MDPDQTLKDIISLANAIQDEEPEVMNPQSADELATMIIELDAWIKKGGVAPQAWLAPITVQILS